MMQKVCVWTAPGLILLLLAVTFSACRPVQTATGKLMQLERTACMGPCPVDQLTVYSDGRLAYQGGTNAPRTGSFASQLTAAERKELITKFEAAKFFAFQDSYVSTLSDLPTRYISYWQGNKSKRIRNYDGAPEALLALESELINLIKADRWRRTVIPAQ